MEKRATTTKQKHEVILRLYRLWKKNPDLRFAQLIGNCYRERIYYKEDFDFVEELEQFYHSLSDKLSN